MNASNVVKMEALPLRKEYANNCLRRIGFVIASNDQCFEKAIVHLNCVSVALSSLIDDQVRTENCRKTMEIRERSKGTDLFRIGVISLCYSVSLEQMHSSFKLMEYAVSYKWNDILNHHGIKMWLISLFKDGAPVSMVTPFPKAFYERCVASVIACIAKKEWPDSWPELFQCSVPLIKQSSMAPLVYAQLVEDIILFERAEERKVNKKNFVSALKMVYPSIILESLEYLKEYSGSDENTVQKNEEKVKTLLSMLSVTVQWQGFQDAVKRKILEVVCPMLLSSSQAVRRGTIEFFSELFAVKHDKTADIEIFLPYYASVLETLGKVISTSEDKDVLEPCAALVGSLIKYVAPVSNDETLQHTGNVVLCLFEDGVDLVEKGLNCIGCICKFQNCEQTLLYTILLHLMQRAFEKIKEFSLIQQGGLKGIKPECTRVLKLMAQINEFMYIDVRGVIEAAITFKNMNFWDICSGILEAVTSNLHAMKQSEQRDQVYQACLQDFILLLTTFKEERDVGLKSSILSSLSSMFIIIDILKERQDVQGQVLTALEEAITEIIKGLGLPRTELDYVKSLRTHCLYLLLKLASKYPQLMNMSFPLLRQAARELGSTLSTQEQAQYIELLVTIGNCWPLEDQKSFISMILGELQWEPIYAYFSNVEMFKEFAQSKNESMTKGRTSVLRCLKALSAVMKKSAVGKSLEDKTELFTVLRHYLLPTIKVLKIINNVLGSSTWLAEEKYAKSQHPPPEIYIKLGSIQLCHSFVRSCKYTVYPLISDWFTLFTHMTYREEGISSAVYESAIMPMQSMAPDDAENIFHTTIKPYVLNCPDSLMEVVVGPSFHQICLLVIRHIVDLWNSLRNGIPDIKEEVKRSNNFINISRELFDLIEKITINKTARAHKVSDPDTVMESADDYEEPMEAEGSNRDPGPSVLKPFGQTLALDKPAFDLLIFLCTKCLDQFDSIVTWKACVLLVAFMSYIDEANLATIFNNSLRAAARWKEDPCTYEASISVIDSIVLLVGPESPIVANISNFTGREDDLNNLITIVKAGCSTKKRKEALKRIISYKTDTTEGFEQVPRTTFRNLPPIELPSAGFSSV